jgi:hypothetical protein
MSNGLKPYEIQKNLKEIVDSQATLFHTPTKEAFATMRKTIIVKIIRLYQTSFEIG